MSETIKHISEAFSVEPRRFSICQKEKDYTDFDKPDIPHVHTERCIERIVIDGMQTDSNTYTSTCVGYDFNGGRVFQFILSAVNIEY